MVSTGQIGYAELLARQTLGTGIETFNISNTIPGDVGIEGLVITVDGLQAGGTDSADNTIVEKLDVIRIFGNTIKSELTATDLVRMNHRIWGANPLHAVGETDNEGLAAHMYLPFNPRMKASGSYEFNAPWGAGPGQISQIQLVTAADQTATDTLFLTVDAVTNSSKTGVMPYLQYKRKLRTAVAGAIEIDPIADMDTFCGNFQFVTTGIKDATTALPAALTVRGVSLTIGGNQVTAQIPGTALQEGGVYYMALANAATLATLSNYDAQWWDFGLYDGGRPLGTNWAIRCEEGAADARRSYMLGMGR